ncbi:protein translocase subunit SecF [Rickettsiales endosymbiont of Peranema trichophorum]|uniref:protein translocase subunit SecF n=1 Tax=Rickettsiales endosymbiont of Peranema trichophorum TaxID=2486577 RepID=UPI001023995E|nr:protein translocase subunit SecF [Rickettsiales endosymbiont of Peranema trichophorum]RZI45089.1 protein translocase subunit SecF [Rickettsiales endosymbiont of Peranema trichophorum]
MRFPITLVPEDTNIDFIGKRHLAFTCSIVLTILTLLLLATRGLNMGIDFVGGLLLEIKTEHKTSVSEVRNVLRTNNYEGATIQSLENDNIVLIRIMPKQKENNAEIESIKALLRQHYGDDIEFRKVDIVGPKVSTDLMIRSIAATLLALGAMMVYIWLRFNWQYGVGAVIALFHDTFFILGFYSVTDIEFNLSSVAAILTVIGYSVNDSIVMLDRFRENARKYKNKDIGTMINMSINETLSRTVMTVLTTVVGCTALVLFGGDVIFGCSIAILVGIVFGTYSSIYIALPILLYTNLRK